MEETTARFQVDPDVVTREIDEGLLLVNLRTGLTWKVNQVGAEICRRLDGATDVATIVAELDRRYQVGAETLRRDVDALLGALQQQGIVHPVPPVAGT
jgi:hypothetical protein